MRTHPSLSTRRTKFGKATFLFCTTSCKSTNYHPAPRPLIGFPIRISATTGSSTHWWLGPTPSSKTTLRSWISPCQQTRRWSIIPDTRKLLKLTPVCPHWGIETSKFTSPIPTMEKLWDLECPGSPREPSWQLVWGAKITSILSMMSAWVQSLLIRTKSHLMSTSAKDSD